MRAAVFGELYGQQVPRRPASNSPRLHDMPAANSGFILQHCDNYGPLPVADFSVDAELVEALQLRAIDELCEGR